MQHRSNPAPFRRKSIAIGLGIGFMIGAMLTAIAFLLLALSATPGPAYDTPCTATAVWDGDGPIWCEEGPKIRLSGIAARELDETCKPGHPCPEASGASARGALVALLGGPTGRLPTGHVTVAPIALRCAVTGTSRSRTTALCILPDGTDLSCAMVASGTALVWDQYWHGHRCPS